MFQCFYPSSFLDKKQWKGSTETVIAVTYYNQQANQTWQHLQFNFPFFSWWETRNRKISTVAFRMEKENYLWRYRSLQFQNGLTRKLLFHLTFKQTFWILWPNGKYPVWILTYVFLFAFFTPMYSKMDSLFGTESLQTSEITAEWPLLLLKIWKQQKIHIIQLSVLRKADNPMYCWFCSFSLIDLS